MATIISNPPAKIKIDFQDPVTGTKFSEEPLYISNFKLEERASLSSVSLNDMISDFNSAMTELCSLTSASCTAKHIIYDYSITE